MGRSKVKAKKGSGVLEMRKESSDSIIFTDPEGYEQEFRVGHTVFVKASGEPSYIAKVLQIDKKQERIKLNWYYKPEDVKGGRQPWHGKREVFQTKVCDWNPFGCIEGVCAVHTLEKYENLPEFSEIDHYCRFHYSPHSGAFKPDIVPVYCICEIPYNPDRPMVECEACNDWFHYDCVGYEDRTNRQDFVCAECAATRSKRQKRVK